MKTTKEIVSYAHDLLKAGVQHPTWAIKFAACEAFAYCQNPIGLSILKQSLSHENAGIRDRSIIALCKLKASNFAGLFEKGLEDSDPMVRGHSIEALAKTTGQSSLDAILNTLQDKNDFVKECSIMALQFVEKKYRHSILEEIARGKAPYQFVYILRLSAAYYLAEDNNSIGIEVLRNTLQSHDIWVSFLAACNLADLGYDDGKEQLQKMVATGGWNEKIIALKALLKLDKNACISDTLYRPKQIPDILTSLEVALILDHTSTKDILSKALNCPEENIQEYAIETIGRAGKKEFVDLLDNILTKGKEHLRAKAVQAIEEIGDVALLPKLTPTLLCSHWLLRLLTARIVVQMTVNKDL